MGEDRLNIKAIFFDIDGTLLSGRTGKVPESAVLATRKARQNGILVFVATGRHRLQLRDIRALDGVRFDGGVTLNGQYCYDGGGHVVYKRGIAPADVKRMAAYAEETATPCMFWEEDAMYISRVDETVRRVHNGEGLPALRTADAARVAGREILQMGLYLNGKDVPGIVSELSSCAYTRWNSDGIDIIPREGNKWVGCTQLLRHIGLSPAEAMAFGDGDNDVEMLAGAGFSVALGNAADAAKSAADYVTGRVDEDGIYTAMRRFFPWMT